MFYDCVNVHHIPEMHVNTTAKKCCYEMFRQAGYNVTDNNTTINMLGDNTRLSSNDDTLAENCYYQMFYESKTCEDLHDKSTGLYLYGNLYVADEFMREKKLL